MHNLDDLIQNITNDELREIPGNLSSSQQKSIESRILAEIHPEVPEKLVFYRRSSKRKWLVLGLAAILILLISVTAVAATKNEWDIRLTNFMGLNDPSTLQLESGEVEIKTSASSSGLTITDITSIGDKNSAYIRMDTNYKLPEDFDETTDYILPENFSISITNNNKGLSKDHGATLTCFYEDGYLGFLLSISDCKSLNKSYVSVDFENLILYHDLHVYDDSAPEEEMLLVGFWDLDWKYSYESSTKTYRMSKKMEILDNTVWLTRVDVSPISIRLEGKRAPEDFDKAWGDSVCVQEIGFKDGTVIVNPEESAGGRSNTAFNLYLDIHSFHQTIDPEKLDYIILEDQRINF